MLRGVRSRAQREREDRLTLAFETAVLTGTAQAGKLEKLETYVRRVRPRPKMTPGQMLAVFQDLAAQGAPITITRTEGAE